jgi:hypothetical protein
MTSNLPPELTTLATMESNLPSQPALVITTAETNLSQEPAPATMESNLAS